MKYYFSTKTSGQVTSMQVIKMSQFTGQVVTDCQSENVYCLLNTLHKLKDLSSNYSLGNHTS